jgi:hypothetical protein
MTRRRAKYYSAQFPHQIVRQGTVVKFVSASGINDFTVKTGMFWIFEVETDFSLREL